MSKLSIRDEALRYAEARLSVIPTGKDKRPCVGLLPNGKWEVYQSQIADADTIRCFFANGANVAIVTGAVSGGLLAIDFDEPRFYDAWRAEVGNLAEGLVVQKTGKGFHVLCLCPKPGRSEKLAWVADDSEESGRRAAIETKAEGGYILAAPSLHGETGRLYEVIAGDLTAIPAISQAHANALIEAARKLNECPYTRQQLEAQAKDRPRPKDGQSVIDAYNQATPIESALEQHGYKVNGTRAIRPGGEHTSIKIKEGKSFHHNSNDPLSDGYRHSAFDIFCQLDHAGDVKAAVKAAAEKLGIAYKTSKRPHAKSKTNAHQESKAEGYEHTDMAERHELDSSVSESSNNPDQIPPALTDADDWLPLADIMAAFGRGETGDAELLAQLYTDRIACDHAESSWYLWNGYAWERDRRLQAGSFVANAVAAQYIWAAAEKKREAGNGENPEVVEDLWKRAGSLRYRAKIASVLDLGGKQPQLSLTGDEWDSNPWLLGVANGTLNLKTGELQPGRPIDYIRNVAPTEWRGLDYPAQRWEQFLLEIFAGEAALISFVQRLFGYGITGLSVEHVLAVLWGEGRNGKDTLLETLARVLGPLASPVSSEVLLDGQRNPNAATPHLYALRPLRLAWVSETNEGARLDAGQVKLLTGGGTLVARPLYGKPVRFTPQYLLLLVTNYKPHASADDYALWKRILLVPFTQAFVDNPEGPNEHQRDPGLVEKLKAESPGILAWLVNGCLTWQQEGLNPPESVKAATEEYQQDEDTMGQFIAERCVTTPNAEVKAGEIYAAYSEWARSGNLKPMNQTAFGRRMAKRFKKRASNGVIYEGVGLRV